MAKLAGIFVSTRNLKLIGLAVWVASFIGVALLLAAFSYMQVREAMRQDAQVGLEQFARLEEGIQSAFQALRADVTATPCSPEFYLHMRKVAYLPDGLNEFFYAPGGEVHCSLNANRFTEPVQLGEPDFTTGDGKAFWIDRDVSFAGLPGLAGTIVLQDQFATVVPRQDLKLPLPTWIKAEAVLVAPNGRWWHRSGHEWVHQDVQLSQRLGWIDGLSALRQTVCVPEGFHCIATRASVAELVANSKLPVAVLLILAGTIASWITRISLGFLRRYWSFEARFLRTLDESSIVCVYQPIIEVKTRAVVGCEVLARWRDIDDTIVSPDRFLPFVQKHNLTSHFTGLVVDRAYRDLSEAPFGDRCLQVNFNVFPRELDAASLIRTFSIFEAAKDRFELVLEIVECDDVDIGEGQSHIRALRQAGFKVYMDDFGTGYSTLRHLAELDVDGVKLDRSFAMAPIGSIMSEMLRHAIDMVHAAGRKIVVEGVETAERLAQLEADTARVDFAQGYLISCPLDCDRFSRFVRTRSFETVPRRNAA
ncbi:EAL domain-containing protein [Aquibium sp. LZ166]|uniref:cyclic-guanylate-specific phosphodiesterase n=1 Tax=Aquibium pacificus TaxID=3153579 RepID=A0ABV3SF88_9HYPH